MRNTLVLFAFVALGCVGNPSSTSPASASLAGIYRLKTVDGSSLPFAYQSGANQTVITQDVLTVADGGTWTEQGAYTLTVNGSTTSQVIADSGTLARAGTAVAFFNTSQDVTSYSGTFTGSGFELTDQTFTYVFSK